MSPPLEWGFEVFIGEDIRKQGFGDTLVISLDVFGKFMDSDVEVF